MTNDPEVFNLDGYEEMAQDGRYNCVHCFIEEVSYTWFTQVSGDSIVLPKGVAPPIVFCGRGEVRPCLGKHCGHYVNEYLEGGEE